MSNARSSAMASMQTSIQAATLPAPQADDQLDADLQMQSSIDKIDASRGQGNLSQTDIDDLEDAKADASSKAVKEQIDAEIARDKAAKAEIAKAGSQSTYGPVEAGQKVYEQADASLDRVKGVAQDAWQGLARAATPGTIFLPVALLLLLFFVLLPVGGHTRAEWLWYAVTGNALINTDTNAANQNTGPPASTDQPIVPFPGTTFTGVE